MTLNVITIAAIRPYITYPGTISDL